MTRRIQGFMRQIFVALNEGKVRYLVVGGIASILYGVPRMTFDVDLIVDFKVPNLKRLTAALGRIGFYPRVPAAPEMLADARQRRAWIKQKGMQVFAFIEEKPPFRIVDIMIQHTGSFGQLRRHQTIKRVHGVRIPLAPRTHLFPIKHITTPPPHPL